MNIVIPEKLKSSKGDGKLSRTIKGVAGVVVLGAAMFTPLSEVDVISLINQGLVVASALYAFYGLAMKLWNKHQTK